MADDSNTIEQNLEQAQARNNADAGDVVKSADKDQASDKKKAVEDVAAQANDIERRRQDLTEQLHRQFIVSGSKIRFRDKPSETAFSDRGNKLSTTVNDPKATKAMLLVTEMKGWKSIKVSGHEDFRRQVWEEASTRGIKVQGYDPTQEEQKALKTVLEKRERAPKANSQERNTIEAAREKATTKGAEGILIKHGKAPYQHDKNNSDSYYVNLKTDKGDTTVWGVDLERAVGEKQFKPGDKIRIERKGKEPVTVETTNDKGEKKTINTNRVRFEVRAAEAKTVESVAVAIAEKTVQNPSDRKNILQRVRDTLQTRLQGDTRIPQVQVYDAKAASQQKRPEKASPVVENTRERSR